MKFILIILLLIGLLLIKNNNATPTSSPNTLSPTTSPTTTTSIETDNIVIIKDAIITEQNNNDVNNVLEITITNDIDIYTNSSYNTINIPSNVHVSFIGKKKGDNTYPTITCNDLCRLFTIKHGAIVKFENLILSNGLAFDRDDIDGTNPATIYDYGDNIYKAYYKSVGGAIFNGGIIEYIRNVVFQNNIARGGGAIFNYGRIKEISFSQFNENRATKVETWDSDPEAQSFFSLTPTSNYAWFSSRLDITQDDLINLQKAEYDAYQDPSWPFLGGGAISQVPFLPGPTYGLYKFPNEEKPVGGKIDLIEHTIFYDNTANAIGGAVYVSGGEITQIDSCKFQNNTVSLESGWGDAFYSLATTGGAIAVITQLPGPLINNNNSPMNSDYSKRSGQIVTISNSTFDQNYVKSGQDAYNLRFAAGGAIFIAVTDDLSKNGTFLGSLVPDQVPINELEGGASIGTIANCEFTDNYVVLGAEGSFDDATGGAIALGGNIETIANSTFTNNRADRGGAIGFLYYEMTSFMLNSFYFGTISEIIGSEFESNTAKAGGAIAAISANLLWVESCIFKKNAASVSGNVVGNEGEFEFESSSIISNGYGGAILLQIALVPDEILDFFPEQLLSRYETQFEEFSGSTIISNSEFYENIADDCASAICANVYEFLRVADNSIFKDNYVSESSAGGAGAIKIQEGQGQFENVLFQNNQGVKGGAVLAEQLSFVLVSTVRFIDNFAKNRGGALFFEAGASGLIDNSRFFSNTANSSCTTVTTCDVNGLSCGETLSSLWEGCADGVGGAIYSAGSLSVTHSIFDSSTIDSVPRLPLDKNYCNSQPDGQYCSGGQLLYNVAAAKQFYINSGIHIYTKGDIVVMNTTFVTNTDDKDFDEIAPKQTVVKCDDTQTTCGPNAICVDADDELSVLCSCQGVYKGNDGAPYDGIGCILQEFNSDDTSTLKSSISSEVSNEGLPKVELSWEWDDSGSGNNLQGAADSFYISYLLDPKDGFQEIQVDGTKRNYTFDVTLDMYELPLRFSIAAEIDGEVGKDTALTTSQNAIVFCNEGRVPVVEGGIKSCQNCPKGSYRENNACKTCPDDFPTTKFEASTNIEQCLPEPSAFKAYDASGNFVKISCAEGNDAFYCSQDAETGLLVDELILKPGYWRGYGEDYKTIKKCPHENYCWGGQGLGWVYGDDGYGDESIKDTYHIELGGDGSRRRRLNFLKEYNYKMLQLSNERFLQDDNDTSTSFNNSIVLDYCRPYHTGPFCEKCIDGYVIKDAFCEICDSAAEAEDQQILVIQIVIFVFVILIVAAGFLLYNRRQIRKSRNKIEKKKYELEHQDSIREAEAKADADGKSRANTGLVPIDVSIPTADLTDTLNWFNEFMIKVKIVLGFLQVIASFGDLFADDYPPEVKVFLDRLAIFSFDFTRFLSFGCTVPTNHYSRLLFYTLFPVFLFAMVGVVFGIISACNKKNKDSINDLKKGTITAILFFTFLIYPGVSTTIFKTLACETYLDYYGNEQSSLRADYTIDCNAPDRPFWITYAFIAICVYPVGIVVLYVALLVNKRTQLNPKTEKGGWGTGEDDEVILLKRDNDPDITHLKFLWTAYEPDKYYFEAIELMRKLAQTSLVIFFLDGSATQIVVTMLICMLSLAIIYSTNPYLEDADDNLAVLAQWSLILASLAALMYKLDVSETDGYTDNLINIIMIITIVLTPIMGLYEALIEFWDVLPHPSLIGCLTCGQRKRTKKSAKAERKEKFEKLKEQHKRNSITSVNDQQVAPLADSSTPSIKVDN